MRLFVSYAEEDREPVVRLAGALAGHGHDPWLDRRLDPGAVWKAELQQQIVACERFVFVMSAGSLASKWCLWELGVANRALKPVVPVRIGPGGRVHAVLQRLHYADMTGDRFDAGLAELLRGIEVATPDAVDHSIPVEAPADAPPDAFYKRHWSDGFVRQQFAATAPTEHILIKVAANRLRPLESVGGRLTLTDRRLLFEAHSFNKQRDRLEISLNEIAAAGKYRSLFAPSGIEVRLRTGERHRFFLWNTGRLLELLRMYSSG